MHESEAREGTERVVVGVDGSLSSKEALAWAIRYAETSGATVTAVATWELPTSYGWAPMPEGLDLQGDTKGMLQSVVADAQKDHDGVELAAEVYEGHPAAVLTELSKDASLVVVGSRGHGEFVGMMIGSVSQHLAAAAHCPVVVVHDHTSAPAQA